MSTMFRDSHTASANFRLSSNSWDGIPKPKFLYYVRFVRANNGSTNNDWAQGVGIIAKQIDRPHMEFETEVLNQYNKKRVVQKRVSYQPVNFTFHDTVDNRVLHMFEDYFRYYYSDPRQSSSTDWAWDVTSSAMNQGAAGGWGFLPPTGTNNTYFFSHIEFYYLYGGTYSRYDVMNPKITQFSPGEMDYADSTGAEITMTVQYEGIVYQGNNFSLSDQDGLLAEMGLNQSSFYEPSTSSGSATLGSSTTYSGQGAVPTYGSAQLAGTSTAASNVSSNSVNRSSSLVSSDLSFNSIFSGVITRPTTGITNAVTAVSTQGDNIAKRIVGGMK